MFATAGTPRKVRVCRELGADVAINYRDEDFDERIADETGGAGVDVDPRQHGRVLPAAQRRARWRTGGRLIVLGLQGGVKGELDLGALLAKRGDRARRRPARPPAGAEGRRSSPRRRHAVWPMIEAGAVRPVIDRVLTLDDAAEAHRLVESSEHIGKVLLRVG